jgi:tetratricopeptide (TPR) repeat protein
MLKNKNRDPFPPVAVGAGGLLLAGLLLTGCHPPGTAALLDGKKLLDQGKAAAAVAPLTDATAILKTNALAWSYLGLAHQQCGQLNEAVNSYGQALRYNRDFNEIHFNLGCALLDLDQADAAKAEFIAYTLRQTRDPQGWLKLGQAQVRLRDPAAAEKSFTESLRQGTNAPALDGLGQIQVQRTRFRDAVPYFTAALKHDPACRSALRNLAWVQYQNLRNYPAALQAFREYTALKPPPYDLDLARSALRDLEQKLAPLPPPVPIAVVVAAPHTNAAKPVATNPIAAPPVRPTVPIVAVAPPVRPTPPPTNATPAPRAPATPPRSELPVVQLPDAPDLKPAEDVPAPVPAPEVVAPPSRPPPTPPETLAATPAEEPKKKGFFAKLNPLNLIRKETKPASTSKPAPTPTVPPAAPVPVAVSPSTPEANPLPTTAPLESQISNLKSQIPPAPPPIPRYTYRHPAPPISGKRAEAAPLFNAAIQSHQAGRPAEALENYLKAAQADPAFFEAWYNLSLISRDLGQTGSCLTACEIALALKPDSADARFNFAFVLRDAGYPLDAAAELETLLAQNPNDIRGHLALANLCAQKLSQPKRARTHYLKVMELDARNPQAANIRDWLVAHPGGEG